MSTPPAVIPIKRGRSIIPWVVCLLALWSVPGWAFTDPPLLDDFNRANENPLAGTATQCASPPCWSTQIISTETGILGISSNVVTLVSGTGISTAWWNVETFGPDIWVSMTVPDATAGTGSTVGLYLRLQDPGVASATDAYYCLFYPSNTPELARIFQITNSGTPAQRAEQNSTTDPNVTLSDGNSVGCSVEGNVVKGWVNQGAGWNQVVSWTDGANSIPTAGAVGFRVSAATLIFDNARACTVSGGACETGAAVVGYGLVTIY